MDGNTRTAFRTFRLLFLVHLLAFSNPSFAAYDSIGSDLIIDAPWRTVRDYVPVLFFTPEFEAGPNLKFTAIRLYNFDRETKEKKLIFSDSRGTTDDQFECRIEFISDMGKARTGLRENETVDSFWHYIARVPVSCIGVGTQLGRPGVHYLWGEMEWAVLFAIPPSTALREHPETDYKVLRVVVTPDGFAKFSPVDHQYDVHVHTIAEQTSWHGITNINAAKKAFGGPLSMLMESAYALGLVDTQLKDANWSAYKNQIVTTDHNGFFSGNPVASGAEPDYGPTKDTDGEEQEFRWYRNTLGVLGAEEITVQGANGELVGTDVGHLLPLGSHFLSYGAPHFEGPWHGGPGNEISITHAITRMGSENGFGYASHPESSQLGWSTDYYERAIGLGFFNGASAINPVLQANGEEFVFKGLQVWNKHEGMKSRDSGSLGDSESHRFNPFTLDDTGQKFEVPKSNWRNGHDKTYAKYKQLLRRGLSFSFSDRKDHVFIRKLYMSAGTDSHGDFNYYMSITASALSKLKSGLTLSLADGVVSASNNAFGRVRTYTLTSQRYIRAGAAVPPNCPTYPFCGGYHAAPSDYPVQDYQEGNTVVTDGPVGRFSADANCRFNSDIHKLSWHDSTCLWENHDGMIGGRGKFDGGNTMLAPVGNQGVYVNAEWIGKNDYLDDSSGRAGPMRFSFVKLNPDSENKSATFSAGGRQKPTIGKLNDILGATPIESRFPDKSALILEGQLGVEPNESKFMTNPVWIAPYRITVDAPSECPIKRRQLRVTLEFAISMDTTLPRSKETLVRSGIQSRGGDPATYVARSRQSALDPVLSNQEMSDVVDDTYKEQPKNQGIRVQVKPLSPLGESGTTEYRLANSSGQWQAVKLSQGSSGETIGDAKFTISNDMDISCGSGWNAITHRPDSKFASFAVVVDQIRDMHKNYLNPIGTTFVVRKGGLISDPIGPIVIPPHKNPDTAKRSCSRSNVKLCTTHGATCDVVHATNGSTSDVCRWSSKTSAGECGGTVGIWTAPTSRYSRRHPDAVRSGTTGACITEAKNIKGKRTSCSASNVSVCTDNRATCDVVHATDGSASDVCRWSSSRSEGECGGTVGIWTAPTSRYSRRHPDAVRSGTTGACITEAKNIKDRID